MKSLPLDELNRLLTVDVQTGQICWNERQGKHHFNSLFAGKIAGGLNSQGYWVVNIGNVHHRAHHIVWRVVHGYWPSEIDHIDGDRTNNCISNLREVTRAENRRNVRLTAKSKFPCHGIYEQRGRFFACIWDKRKRISLGGYGTLEDAVKARKAAAVQLGYHPNHGDRVLA